MRRLDADELAKLIYLDQNAWIDLVKIEEKTEKSDSEKKILEIIYSSVDSGKAIFPLSIVHMVETSNILNERQREQLGTMMARLSKGYSFSPYVDSHIEFEVQQLVSEKLGYDTIDPRTILLKQGVEHLVGGKGTVVSKNGDKSKKPPQEVIDKISLALLDPDTIAFLLTKSKPNPSIQEAQINQVEKMEQNRRRLLIHRDRDLRRRVFLTKSFIDILVPHTMRILSEKGLPPDFLLKEIMSKEEFDSMLGKIPTALTLVQLTMRRDMQFNRPIEVNDIADVWGMSLAIPYSDIVVTENMMATFARHAKLDSICNTIILTSVHELHPFLLARGDAPQSKMICPKCGKKVNLGDWLYKFDNPPTEIILYTCKTPNCEYKNYPFAKNIETGDILAPFDLREILYPPDWVAINKIEQK